jgi:hypothetical protein
MGPSKAPQTVPVKWTWCNSYYSTAIHAQLLNITHYKGTKARQDAKRKNDKCTYSGANPLIGAVCCRAPILGALGSFMNQGVYCIMLLTERCCSTSSSGDDTLSTSSETRLSSRKEPSRLERPCDILGVLILSFAQKKIAELIYLRRLCVWVCII